MRMADRIKSKLTTEFEPEHIEIIDESEQHRGHAGYRDGGQTHFRVILRAHVFADMSRVARQRAVYACLRDELAAPEGIHALALDVSG